MIKEAIAKVVVKENLQPAEMETVFTEIMSGAATPAQIAAFLVGLRLKPETVEEITAAARVMRKFAAKIQPKSRSIADTCGTGGDGQHTFNVSTVAALVLAAAGGHVAKHGNRSVSSQCGSADLLEKLGVNINAPNEVIERCIDEVGIGFLFAPQMHTATKFAMPVRREIGMRTVFNILGPLTNPAGVTHQLLGVYQADLVEPLARVLRNLGLRHALVVHGEGGLDEVTTTGFTRVAELKNNEIKNYEISPEDFGFKRVSIEALKGGNADANADIVRDILNGGSGPKREMALFNAGCAIYAADIRPSIGEGIKLAAEVIDSRKASAVLNKLVEYTSKN